MRLKRATAGLLALGLAASAWAEPPAPATVAPAAPKPAVDYGPIPGPRDCFWLRGPSSGDPYINIAYPDANVFYWAAVFSIPEGAKLTIEGDYPHSRYMSFISYDERGVPIESLADYLVQPLAGPAPAPVGQKTGALKRKDDAVLLKAPIGEAVNPFIPGHRRDSINRRYRVNVVNAPVEAQRAVGERSAASSGNVLHAPAYAPGQQTVLYRIYLPDTGAGPGGGVKLPAAVVELADGKVLRGEEACKALKTRQPLAVSNDAASIPPDTYRELISQPGKPDTWPAKNPADWFIQLDRESLLGIYTGKINENARRSEGGFYPNLDNHYIRTIINRKHGPVFLLRGKAPTTPKTIKGDPVMGDGELRYWSVCSNEGLASTRVNACVYDEGIPLDATGSYTIMVSKKEDRPRNAIAACGIAWLPISEKGDGLFDRDASVVQIRHMLTAPAFQHSIQRVLKQADLSAVMGPYLPTTRYLTTSQAESFFPCLPAPRPAAP